MGVLVTGAAGFIGSTLAEALVSAGHQVRGVDCLTPYYSRVMKRRNLCGLLGADSFEFCEADLRTADLAPLLDGVDVVFHQAAQPGVRLSWHTGFGVYVEHNVLATQRLLEALRETSIRRLVYASSSSVYGNASRYPTMEDDLPAPFSPYGVTKLAGEHLCGLYAANWGVPTVALRYFTVYGPRQRPDMAIHRLIAAARTGEAFPLYGSGDQVRDFTFVDDVVAANLMAAQADLAPGTVLNVAGGSSVRVIDLVDKVGELLSTEVLLDRLPVQAGDVAITGGSTQRATELLGWAAQVTLQAGLEAQVAWQLQLAREGVGETR